TSRQQPGTETDLCHFLGRGGARGYGSYDATHQLAVTVYDADENEFVAWGLGGTTPATLFTFLETQRLDLSGDSEINPAQYMGGWVDLYLPGSRYEQAFVGVQHSGRGSLLSVGHAAVVLDPGSCSVIPPFSNSTP